MNRSELQHLAALRRDEAGVLLREGLFSGSFYLAGYAVECGLKSVIASQTRQFDFPEKSRWEKAYTHDLALLLRVAGLELEFKNASKQDRHLRSNWEYVVKNWSEGARHAAWLREDAEAMLNAVSSTEGGVLLWVTKHW